MEKGVKWEFIGHRVAHIRRVQDNMIMLEMNLEKLPFPMEDMVLFSRGMLHDMDKLSGETMECYLKIDEYYYKTKNGIPTDLTPDCVLPPRIDLHYKKQPHHLCYHMEMGSVPSDVDICEICCDTYAIGEGHGGDAYGDTLRYLTEELIPSNEILWERKEDILKVMALLRDLKD